MQKPNNGAQIQPSKPFCTVTLVLSAQVGRASDQAITVKPAQLEALQMPAES
jgi:hypothetical protein